MTKIALDTNKLLGFRLDGQQNGAKIADVIKGAKIGESSKLGQVVGAKIGGSSKLSPVTGAKVGLTIKN